MTNKHNRMTRTKHSQDNNLLFQWQTHVNTFYPLNLQSSPVQNNYNKKIQMYENTQTLKELPQSYWIVGLGNNALIWIA